MQQRIRAAERYARGRPGVVAIVVRDRVTGAVWRNEYADRLIWAASTVKLAMAVDLLLRDRAGVIALTATDRDLIHRMLHVSDDAAASILWDRYGGADYATRFPSYGLVSTTFVAGLPHRWGRMKTTADDLDRLMGYVLDRLPSDLRAYVLGEMRSVGANQQWGVWGAGPGRHPGNKDGWAYANGSWNISSVGFAGPGERYTLAMMNDLRGQAGGDAGRATETEIARLLFAGT